MTNTHRLYPAILLALVSQTAGCLTAAMQQEAARVRALDPRPLVDLPDSRKGLRLELDSSVPDQFLIPEQNGITAVPVESWRLSLWNGFRNGLQRYFKGKPEASAYRVIILSTNLDYVPTAMFARGVQVVGAAAVQARLRFVARVVAPDGTVLARDSGEVFSTNQWTQAGGSSTTAAEAVAAMYEQIAKHLATVVK